ncbi:TATA box-binding protein-associated factor RNA polymerase I subunit C [Enoplosus armatus]|uniref:TATA box-binding protein-associated factor RNA polymerase I subunit C n=1 Tax=Enoplosus armatus TaxID=215367 RepID=UPI0039962BAB
MTSETDHQFPRQLFPSFYNCGPPDSVLKHCAGNWGSYDRVRPQGGSGPLPSWTFASRNQVRGETWRPTEPVPLPLMSPKNSVLWPSTPPDPLDFTEHMQNFVVDHCQDAFGCMSELLGENFYFKQGVKETHRKDSVHMWKVKNVLDMLQFKICQQSYASRAMDGYCALLSDVVHDVPPQLLGSLLYEELTEQRDRLLFSEGATGGALAFVPFSQSGGSGPQHGCLLYPGNQGRDCLNFHRVELQHQKGNSSCVDVCSKDPFSFQLKGPVRQISPSSLFNDSCVAVRSDRLCGVWRFGERNEPRLLQVINTKEVATCVCASPHVLGEVLVASESGAANLWTVGRGIQKVREEDGNLYFNAKSPWRWCEFSAHPRVMLYADRTGVELTDIRASPVSGHTLFRISNTSECRSGERLILSKYLGDVHSFHHLITTQYSAYIMDERFPTVPMLKCDHMMQSPPLFCHIVPGSASSGSGAGTAKVLLGAHGSQEITLLQYSGGRAEACFSRGPPQALLRPRDSLKHLPVQIPHRQDTATNRLSSPAAGLTCIQKKEGRGAGGKECICILQLTEAGDIFYQILEPEQPDASPPPAAEDDPLPQPAAQKPPQKTDSQPVITDTSSDEGAISPTQDPTAKKLVAETPEREQRATNMYSDSSSEDSESAERGRNLKLSWLQVVVNDGPELDQEGGLDSSGVKDGKAGKDNTDDTEGPGAAKETVSGSSGSRHSGPSELQAPVRLSDGARVTWKQWLQKLMQRSREKKPRPRRLPHFTIRTADFHLSDDEAGDSTEEERVQSLSCDMRALMSKRSLLVHSAASTPLAAPDAVQVPNLVDTTAWIDQLSHRLTVSWEGEELWRAWWAEQLGLNREEKVEALKRKRRREKEVKRAGGRRLLLSGSFTSSCSYQSELDEFSDSAGWSSATSQGLWSDSEGMMSQSQCGTPRAETPSAVMTDTPVPTPTATPQSVQHRQGGQQTPSSSRSLSQTPRPDSTPASRRRTEAYLRSLFAPQDEPSQQDSYFLEERSTVHPPPPPVASSPSSSQRRISQCVPLKNLWVNLSQDATALPSLSQSLSLSQSSQGRPGLSQASQPKKKKSRMGF